MRKLFVLSDCRLSEVQRKEVMDRLNVGECVYFANHLQKIWSEVNPNLNLDTDKLDELCSWLTQNVSKGDYVFVRGEYGATFYLVDFCFKHCLIPIYSTGDHDHVHFRKYMRYKT